MQTARLMLGTLLAISSFTSIAAPVLAPAAYFGSANTFPGVQPGCSTGTLSQATPLSAACESSYGLSQSFSTISAAPGLMSVTASVSALSNNSSITGGYGTAQSVIQFNDYLAIRGTPGTSGLLQGKIVVNGSMVADVTGASGRAYVRDSYSLTGAFFGQNFGQSGMIEKNTDGTATLTGQSKGSDFIVNTVIQFGSDGWSTVGGLSIFGNEQLLGWAYTENGLAASSTANAAFNLYWGGLTLDGKSISGNDVLSASGLNYAVSSVPETETYAMLLAGIGLLVGIARRHKQQ
jgi:hypothetical protein